MSCRALLSIATTLAACYSSGSRPAAAPEVASSHYLFVWAGDADRRESDFLAVLDVDRQSPRYTEVIATLPIGAVGTLLGMVLGYALCLLIQEYKFIELPEGVFLISTVPVQIYLSNFALVAVASFFICLLASIYPARQAAKLDPVEIIRYE